MFQHILVPLDGSSRAELALPLAAHLARQSAGTISLLRAVPPEQWENSFSASKLGSFVDEERVALMREAQDYLAQVSHRDVLAEISVRTQTVLDVPGQAILTYAQIEQADLIVLCSHGYTGFKRWALGSVAQKVARHSPVPVVVIREENSQSPLLHPEKATSVRALVALDGSEFAETALLPAAQLVARLSHPTTIGELHLMRVIQPPSDLEERRYLTYDINIRQFNRSDAERYLRATQDRLTHELAASFNLRLTSSYVEETDIATALMRAAERGEASGSQPNNGYDVIAIATHGKSGIAHWMMGSIAARVLEETKLPVLIVRPQASPSQTPREG